MAGHMKFPRGPHAARGLDTTALVWQVDKVLIETESQIEAGSPVQARGLNQMF